jgi:hypothetical protein
MEEEESEKSSINHYLIAAEEEVAKGVACQSKVLIVRVNNFCISTAKNKNQAERDCGFHPRRKAIIARVAARMIAVDCN